MSEPTLLECPRCHRVIEWYRATTPAPGECTKCHTRQFWKVVAGRRVREPGFVKVMSSQGSQFLTGPGFQEDPNAWRKP